MSEIIEPQKVFSKEEMIHLKKWISRYENPIFFLLHQEAVRVFAKFDQMYFDRTGVTESEYIGKLINEARSFASLSFTSAPNGRTETAFSYDEGERCEFRRKLDSDSSRIWTVIPRQTGH